LRCCSCCGQQQQPKCIQDLKCLRGQKIRKIQGIWLTLCRLTKGGPGRDIGALARPAYMYISDYVRICRISQDTN
jgi:hypothetical protein